MYCAHFHTIINHIINIIHDNLLINIPIKQFGRERYFRMVATKVPDYYTFNHTSMHVLRTFLHYYYIQHIINIVMASVYR